LVGLEEEDEVVLLGKTEGVIEGVGVVEEVKNLGLNLSCDLKLGD